MSHAREPEWFERPKLEEGDDIRSIVVPRSRFRLDFEWTGDRWAHAFRVQVGGDWVELARSLEGDVLRDDPRRIVSPVYQEFHWQEDQDERAEDFGGRAFLLGQSGPHHFAATFVVSHVASGIQTRVDVADRCRGTIDALASTYVVADTPAHFVRIDTEGATWDRHDLGLVALEPTSPARLVVAEAGHRGSHLQIDIPIDPTARTQRFAYHWSFSGKFPGGWRLREATIGPSPAPPDATPPSSADPLESTDEPPERE